MHNQAQGLRVVGEDVAPVKVQEWADDGCSHKGNVLLSASAGYGNSHFIKSVLEPATVARYGKKSVCITAPLGLPRKPWVAMTIHSAAGANAGHRTPKQNADGKWLYPGSNVGRCMCLSLRMSAGWHAVAQILHHGSPPQSRTHAHSPSTSCL